MSEVALAERAVQFAPGVKISSTMSPTERHNAIARAMGAPTVQPAHVTFSGPQGHPHVVADTEQTAREMGATAPAGTIAGKAAPPSPKQLEAANKPAVAPQGAPSAARQAELDAELAAKGLIARPDGRTLAASEVDSEGYDALTEHYRGLMKPLMGKTDADSLATAERFRVAYQNDVRRILDGQQLTAQQIAKLKGSLGKTDTFVARTRETATPAKGQWLDDKGALTKAGQKRQTDLRSEWQALPEAERSHPMVKADYDAALAMTVANARGELAAASFHPSTLSGYTLPPGDYTPHVIQDLAKARAAGLSQTQVNAAIRNLRVTA